MRQGLVCLGVVLFAGFSIPAAPQQDKPKDTATAVDAGKSTGAERKNPVKPTPEGMAAAKKIYGFDCAMCHGSAGDGKGDVAASMNLTMKDWRDPGVLVGMSDGEVYDIIVKGKDKMIGEGDRLPPEKAWNMVNYVRSLAKKEGAEKAPAAAPKS